MSKYSEYPYTEQYLIFGNFITVFSKHKSFLIDLNSFLEPSLNEYATPHFELFTSLEHTHRYLFRTRPNMDDTGMQYLKDGSLIEWDFQTPPFPPYESNLFNGKILALHGAAIMDGDRKVTLILGKKASGKTTISEYLVNKLGMDFFTDETVVINSGTDFVYSFPRKILPRSFENGKIVKKSSSAKQFMNRISTTGGLVDKIIFFDPTDTTETFKVSNLNAHETMSKLLESFQYIGTDIHEGIETFHLLSIKSSKVLSYKNGDFSELKKGMKYLWPLKKI